MPLPEGVTPEAVVHFHRACRYARHGRWQETVREYQRAILLAPSFTGAHNNLGLALLKTGQLEAAESAFLTAASIDPTRSSAYNNLGIALKHQGRLEESIAAFQRAALADPHDPKPHTNMGSLLADIGAIIPARLHLQEALRLDPNNLIARMNLGTVLLEAGEVTAARAVFETVRRGRERQLQAEEGHAGVTTRSKPPPLTELLSDVSPISAAASGTTTQASMPRPVVAS